ncbi:hypothetical protein F5B20DRAFT_584671 [Whalleya microplaca]|nr:hypothetical protein F5B20DRAFT_584671 [Whalleya microplaca]
MPDEGDSNDAAADALKGELESLMKQIEEHETKTNEYQERLESLKTEASMLNDKVAHGPKDMSELDKLHELWDSIKELESEVQGLNQEEDRLSKEMERINEEIQTLFKEKEESKESKKD